MSQHLDSMPSRNELKPFLLDVTDKAYTSGSADNIPCGIYRVYAAATNIPVSDPGYCSTYERENGTKLQIYITDSNRTFTRTKVNGTWTSWQELALNSKITVTTITATKTANIKNNSIVVAKKSGNIVSIYMDVYAASTSSDYVTIANLSETVPTNTYFVMVDSNDGTKMCRLTTSGALQIHGTVADKNYMGSLSCIVTS